MLDELKLSPNVLGSIKAHSDATRSSTFPITLLSDIELPNEPEDLIRGLVPGCGLVVLYGRPGSGKSFIALDMALHIAAGRSWAGRNVRQCGVVYVAAEGSRGFARRVIAATRHHGFSRSLNFALVTNAPNLGQRTDTAKVLAREIAAQLPPGFDIGLVILDTLARTMVGGDESGAQGMGTFIENADTLGRELGITVMPVHHLGKDPSAGMRGSSALMGAVDAALEIDPEVGGVLKLVKMKDGPANINIAFAVETFELGRFVDGDPVTSCVVSLGTTFDRDRAKIAGDLEVDSVVPTSPSPLPMRSAKFLDALRSLIIAEGKAASARYKFIPRDVAVLLQADLRLHAAALGIVGGTDKSCRTLIDRQIVLLAQRGLVNRHEGWIWLSDDPGFTKTEENCSDDEG